MLGEGETLGEMEKRQISAAPEPRGLRSLALLPITDKVLKCRHSLLLSYYGEKSEQEKQKQGEVWVRSGVQNWEMPQRKRVC